MERPDLTQILVLGCGFLGLRVVALARARGLSCLATTRSEARVEVLARAGTTPLYFEALTAEGLAPHVHPGLGVIVTFPPDGHTDARIAPALRGAYGCVYISSTGVYGNTRGVIDEDTPVAPDSPRAQRRLEAEQVYRGACSATVLRAAAIYGPGSGMHARLREGRARIVGDGTRYVSRIHVDDLAALSLGCLEQRLGPETYLAADEQPAPQGEVVRFLAARMGLPVPPSVPLEQAPETLRYDRRIHAARLPARLGLRLRYPNYQVGFAACLAEEAAQGGP